MYYIGIDLGGTSVKAGVIDGNGNILAKDSVKTRAAKPYVEICADMAALAKKVADEAGVKLCDIAGIGVGAPGIIDSARGVVTYSCNFNWAKVPIAAEIQKHTGLPVKAANDANAAALGEALFGGGKGYGDSVLLTLGTGVGSGIIIGGKIAEGFMSAGGEGGHIVIRSGGAPCACGRRGCFETYASATGLIRLTKEAMQKTADSVMWKLCRGDINNAGGKTAFTAMKQGDKPGAAVVRKYIKYLGEGIVNIINLLRPEAIILGGGICAEGEYLLAPLRKFVKKYTYGGKYIPQTKLVTARLENDAGIVGAAALFM